MERYIASVDKSYITLLEKGHIVERGKVAVLSRTHLVIVRDKLLQGPYGFSSPSPVNPEEAYLATFSGSLLAKARVDLAAAVSAITEADEKRFIVAPELIEELDRALLKTIVGTVVDTETSSEMEDLAARSGRTCLVQQKELVESLAGKQGTAIETLMTNLLAAGLMAPTIAAFNSLSREYLNLNRSLGPTNRVADSIIAERFVRVVGELGSEPRILLSVEITTNKAHGNLSRTCACIRSILGDFEAEDVSKAAAEGARALVGRDDEKPKDKKKTNWKKRGGGGGGDVNRNKKPPYKKYEDWMGPCRFCGDKHLNRDCPTREANGGDGKDTAGGKALLCIETEDQAAEAFALAVHEGGSFDLANINSPAELLKALKSNSTFTNHEGRVLVSRIQPDDDDEFEEEVDDDEEEEDDAPAVEESTAEESADGPPAYMAAPNGRELHHAWASVGLARPLAPHRVPSGPTAPRLDRVHALLDRPMGEGPTALRPDEDSVVDIAARYDITVKELRIVWELRHHRYGPLDVELSNARDAAAREAQRATDIANARPTPPPSPPMPEAPSAPAAAAVALLPAPPLSAPAPEAPSGPAIVAGKPDLRRRFYVINVGERRGVAWGTWSAPDFVQALVEGFPAPSGVPTNRAVDRLETAIGFCEMFNTEPILVCSRADGVIPPCAELPAGTKAGALLRPIFDATEAGKKLLANPIARIVRQQMGVVAASDPTGQLPIEPLGGAPALTGAADVPPPETFVPPSDCEPIALPAAVRESVEQSLFDLYRHSNAEGYAPPPALPPYRKAATFSDRLTGTKLVRNLAAKIADYTQREIEVGGEHEAARRRYPTRGTFELKRARANVQTALAAVRAFVLESLDEGEAHSEDYVLAAIANTLEPTFVAAHRRAREYPVVRVCGVEVHPILMGCLGMRAIVKDPGTCDDSSLQTDLPPQREDPVRDASPIVRPQARLPKRYGSTSTPLVNGPLRDTSPLLSISSTRSVSAPSSLASPPALPHSPPCREAISDGRVLIAKPPRAALVAPEKRGALSRPWSHRDEITLVVDTGAARHTHPRKEDMINFKPAKRPRTMSGALGVPARVIGIGDLPVYALDSHDNLHCVIFEDVRCVPEFPDTLLAERRLWGKSRSRAEFQDKCTVTVPSSDGGPPLVFPFALGDDELYEWRVQRAVGTTPAKPLASERVLNVNERALNAHHRPKAMSHISALPADAAATCLHRRLLVPTPTIRKLGELTADVPTNATRGNHDPSSFWIEANATRHHHGGSRYKPSHPGRLVHLDVAGPFRPTAIGGFRWMLVCVDDHGRLKRVYFMRQKSEALNNVRKYVAELEALLNVGRGEPIRVCGAVHSDGGGEFISKKFNDFLEDEGMHGTTSPPYVHDLNGVAERAIRLIMEMVRAALVASNSPVSFWDHAALHVVDILNRVYGPPGSSKSSFEETFGEKPKIMDIMPFGCRVYAVRARRDVSKTDLDSHAWVGINLGKAPRQPGAYKVWLPQYSKLMVTSDVWFDETLMPWRPKGEQRVGPVAPHAALPAAPTEEIIGGPARTGGLAWPTPPTSDRLIRPPRRARCSIGRCAIRRTPRRHRARCSSSTRARSTDLTGWRLSFAVSSTRSS